MVYYKLFRESENHNGFQFKDGLNVNRDPWNTDGRSGGGFYFCKEEDIWHHITLHEDLMWIREVTLPDDASHISFEHEEKAHKILLGPRILFTDFLNESYERCMEAVKKSWYALALVKEQTFELCLAAVKHSGYALQHVKEHRPELWLAAVTRNGYALKHVKEQTPELCMIAVKQDGYAIQFVNDQTYELCMAAVRQNGRALMYVKEPTDELRMAAANQN